MLKQKWSTIRLALLIMAFGGSVLVGTKLATLPKSPDSQTAVNPLATSVPLPEWQFLDSKPLSNSEAIFGRQYRYRKGPLNLTADQYYMISDGNVSRYLFVYSPVHTANAALKIKLHPDVGYYGLVSYKGHAYLSACINPRGGSTVTEQQFTQNRYRHDFQLSRIFPWMLGQTSLLDYRCLWTLLTVPITSDSGSAILTSEAAYKQLEVVWFSWHQWWQANFPPQQRS